MKFWKSGLNHLSSCLFPSFTYCSSPRKISHPLGIGSPLGVIKHIPLMHGICMWANRQDVIWNHLFFWLYSQFKIIYDSNDGRSIISSIVLWIFLSKSLRTLVCWSIVRLCICLFEKINVKTIVPTISNVCAKLNTSPNPNSTVSKRRISQSIMIKFNIYQIDAKKIIIQDVGD